MTSLPVAAALVSQAGAANANATAQIPRPVMPVFPGQVLSARVVSVEGGQIQLNLAGQKLVAMSDIPLEPGDRVRMMVQSLTESRVNLQLVQREPGQGAAQSIAAKGGGTLSRAAALPLALGSQTAQALFSALEQGGFPGLRGSGNDVAALRTALAMRAAEAGVSTPAQAAAFARLVTSGLPTSPALVSGMAWLSEGTPLGRMLATLVGSGNASATAGGGQTASGGATTSQGGLILPSGAAAATATAGAVTAASTSSQAPATAAGSPVATSTTGGGSATNELISQLAAAVKGVADAATSGDGAKLRQAVATLGHGLETRVAGGPPSGMDVRTLLSHLAQNPDATTQTRAMANRAADAITAQAFMGPVMAPQPDVATHNAYLQMPLPGGQTAEVHVNADQEADGVIDAEKGARIAFVLTMSHLGPVLIEASVSAHGVDAIVRSRSPEVRDHLSDHSSGLAEGLARAVPDRAAPRVSVEAMPRDEPESLIPPPPSTGLDASA